MSNFTIVNYSINLTNSFKNKCIEILYSGHSYRLISAEAILEMIRSKKVQIFFGVSTAVSLALIKVYLYYKSRQTSLEKKRDIVSSTGITTTGSSGQFPIEVPKQRDTVSSEGITTTGSSGQFPIEVPEQSYSASLILIEEVTQTHTEYFFSIADQLSFWEGFLDDYETTIYCKDSRWNTPQAKLFLYCELVGFEDEITKLEDEINKLFLCLNEKTSQNESSKQLLFLHAKIEEFKEKRFKLLKCLEDEIFEFEEDKQAKLNKIKGFRNVGNTCYINSALQPLLAIDSFSKLVDIKINPFINESDEEFSARQRILNSLKIFLYAWNEQKSSKELGKLIGNLRKTIFEAGLLQGGFLDRSEEVSFQDAGQFYELVQYVIGSGFTLKQTIKALSNDGRELNIQRAEKTPQGVFYLKGKDSIQNLVNKYQSSFTLELSPENAWKPYDDDDNIHIVQKILEHNQIVGNPPEIMVFRIDNRSIDPLVDGIINLAGLFEGNVLEAEATYELVGFSQNHSQVHWTSVVLENDTWKYCDDSQVIGVQPEDKRFKLPANYAVYKKKNN